MSKTIARCMFELQQAIENCERSGNQEWLAKHRDSLAKLCGCLPSGAGIDNGTKLVRIRTKSGAELIELHASFHHMNDAGFYDGWTEHTVRVRPSFAGIGITISGQGRNQIKDYLSDTYMAAMTALVYFDNKQERWVVDTEGKL